MYNVYYLLNNLILNTRFQVNEDIEVIPLQVLEQKDEIIIIHKLLSSLEIDLTLDEMYKKSNSNDFVNHSTAIVFHNVKAKDELESYSNSNDNFSLIMDLISFNLKQRGELFSKISFSQDTKNKVNVG